MTVFQCPPCCGGSGCSICADDFDRADDTDIDTGSPCGWTELSGSWSIASNQLVCTSAGVAQMTTVHPAGSAVGQLTASIKHDTSGGVVYLIIGDASSTGYVAAKVTFGTSSKIEIIRDFGGDTSMVSKTITIDANTTHTVAICVREDKWVTAFLDGVGVLSALVSAMDLSNEGAALKSTGSGNAYFDDLEYSRGFRTDDDESCDPCALAGSGCGIGSVSAFVIYPSTYLAVTLDIASAMTQACSPESILDYDYSILDGTHEFHVTADRVVNSGCVDSVSCVRWRKVLRSDLRPHSCNNQVNCDTSIVLILCVYVPTSDSGELRWGLQISTQTVSTCVAVNYDYPDDVVLPSAGTPRVIDSRGTWTLVDNYTGTGFSPQYFTMGTPPIIDAL